jgi:3-hydroxyacyl-[acyl-carrier-protein] dehydratase
MRFLLYDKIITIDKGKSIVGVKTFSLSDESLRRHYKKSPVVPGVMFIESMAQLLGWLIIYSHDFKFSAIMSLIENVRIPPKLRPGFEAEIHAEIVSSSERDSLGMARMFINGRLVASIGRIIYSHTYKVDREQLAQLFNYYSGLGSTPPQMQGD